MADLKSKLALEIDVETRQAFAQMAGEIQKAEKEAADLEKQIKKIGDSEIKLTEITNQEVRKRIDAYRQEQSALERRNAVATKGSITAKHTGGSAGGGGIPFIFGGGKGKNLLSTLGRFQALGTVGTELGSIATSLFSGEGVSGGQIGGAIGSTAAAVATAHPVGRALSPILTPLLQGAGRGIGGLFDSDDPQQSGEAAEKQKEAAEKLKEAADKIDRLEDILRRATDSSVRQAIQASISLLRDQDSGFSAGAATDTLQAVREFAVAQEEQRQAMERFIEDLDALVGAGAITQAQANEFAATRGVNLERPAKQDPDPLMHEVMSRVYGVGGQS